ncbi:MAG: D-sedoheptulose 7-phosphate isomerase [Candidatus Zixiibacteriota bacterium]|nr:MAG: D-sedoheptulose 7-phosphate isomerase [candidate division Zixibacteria bacterium]
MSHSDEIRDYFGRHIDLAKKVHAELAGNIAQAARMLIDCLGAGNKVLLCGNGGSAADAQHIATELTGRFIQERPGLPAVALTTDTSALTALSNDFGFDQVFARQVEALGTAGDLLIAISTSGNSANTLAALQTARQKELRSIALLGRDGGRMAAEADLAVIVPSDYTPHIQEMHITIGHLWCRFIDTHFAG